MSIGLTTTEELIIGDISELQEDLIDLNNAKTSLEASLAKSTSYETIHKKMYDWWNLLSTNLETELKYTSGDWVDTPVTESEIILTSNAEENRLYPIESASYTASEPLRIAQLDGPTDSNFGDSPNPSPPPTTLYGPYEYGQIDKELANTGALTPDPANRAAAQIAQRDALVNYTIPSLESFISEATSELTRYPNLSTLLTSANLALSKAEIAYEKVQAEIDAGSPASPVDSTRRSSYLVTRKGEISSRAAGHSAAFAYGYNQRYGWLNIRCNQINGTLSELVSTQSSIDFIENEITNLEYKISIYEDVV